MKYIIVFFLIAFTCNAQDLQKGFSMLENGDFVEAEAFFKPLYKNDTLNTTLIICYGRALGLGINDSLGNDHFVRSSTYTKGLDFSLNLAESYMWIKDYETAESLYTQLLQNHPTNFVASLGLANSQSSLKKYSEALNSINYTLSLDSVNNGALSSKKSILFGYIDQHFRNGNTDSSSMYLDTLHIKYPPNFVAKRMSVINHLLKKDIRIAENELNVLLESHSDNVDLIKLSSYVSNLNGKPKRSLTTILEQLEFSPTDSVWDYSLFNSFLWNKKFSNARMVIDNTLLSGKTKDWVINNSRFFSAKKKYDVSNRLLDSLLTKYPMWEDARFALAGNNFALNKYSKVYDLIEPVLIERPNHLTANYFKEQIAYSKSFEFSSDYYISNDSDSNKGNVFKGSLSYWLSKNTQFFINFLNKDISNERDQIFGNTSTISTGLSFSLSNKLNFSIGANTLNNRLEEGSSDQFGLYSKVKFNWNNLVFLNARFEKKWQDFTAGLALKNLSYDELSISATYAAPSGFGVYVDRINQFYSDSNSSEIYFASIFYDWRINPLFKTGVNFSVLSFDEQKPLDYFSPSKFYSVEPFVQLLQDNKEKKINYNLLLAYGTQKIENNDNQSAYRLNAYLAYRVKKYWEAGVYYNTTNSASSTITGFNYDELGVRVRFNLLRGVDKLYGSR